MESQPQNPEFKINPENFYPCITWVVWLISVNLDILGSDQAALYNRASITTNWKGHNHS